jgi:hypothetical protein
MQEPDLFFVIPTYRLREVGETVEQYDEHFWRNGQSVRMIVFDVSSRTYCGSWTTSSASSKVQSSCGRPWSKSVTSRKIARGCLKYA